MGKNELYDVITDVKAALLVLTAIFNVEREIHDDPVGYQPAPTLGGTSDFINQALTEVIKRVYALVRVEAPCGGPAALTSEPYV